MPQPSTVLDTEDQASITSVMSIDPSPDTLTSAYIEETSLHTYYNLETFCRACETLAGTYYALSTIGSPNRVH